MKLCFNENDWTHEVLAEDGTVLAAVLDEDEAKSLMKFYEAQMNVVQPQIESDDREFLGWRYNDELGGE